MNTETVRALMTDRWYCRIGKQVRGPLDFKALQALAARGELGVDDEVRTSRSYEWSKAGAAPELFPEAADAGDLLEMLAHDRLAPSRGRRGAKRVTLCYFRSGDDVRGPIPFEELGRMARAGDLDRRDQVRLSAQAEWLEAGSIVGLFNGQAAPPAGVVRSRPSRPITPTPRTAVAPPAPANNDDPERTWHWEPQQGAVTGPLTFEQVHALAQSGRMTRADKVRSGPLHPWVMADSIVGLFQNDETVPVPRATPRSAERPAVNHMPSGPNNVSGHVQPARLHRPAATNSAASGEALSERSSRAGATIARTAVEVPSTPPITQTPPAPNRPAPSPKPIPRATAPVFAPVKRRRSIDLSSLFAGMHFNFGAKHGVVLAVLVIGGILWQFGLPSFSFGIGGGTGPMAETHTLCMELVLLSDQDIITEAQWNGYKDRAMPRIKELATALEQEGDDPETQAMLRCCREYLPAILEAGLSKRPPEWDKMLDALSPT